MFQIKTASSSSIDDLATLHLDHLIRKKANASKGSLPYEMDSIIRRIEKVHSISKGKQLVFLNDLRDNDYDLLKKIILNKPSQLERLGGRISKQIASNVYPKITYRAKKSEPKRFGDYLLDIFNYDSFIDKKRLWNAYELSKRLGVDVCIYCNRNYTYTLTKGRDYFVRPEFDHFLPKSKYPFFAISFYNLIPSCHTCNSNLKRDVDFSTSTNLHPYLNSLDDTIRFTVEFKKRNQFSAIDIQKRFGLMFFMDQLDNFQIKLIKQHPTTSDSLYRKAKRNIDVFKLEDLYNCHKDLVTEMVLNTIIYSESKIQDLLKDFGGTLFNSREDVLRHITKNYPSVIDMPKRPFSKLVKDVHKEFGLRY